MHLKFKYCPYSFRKMFDLQNRRGAEEVLYFLFSRLNPVMCKEEFR